jgi:hypothetical protein
MARLWVWRIGNWKTYPLSNLEKSERDIVGRRMNLAFALSVKTHFVFLLRLAQTRTTSVDQTR